MAKLIKAVKQNYRNNITKYSMGLLLIVIVVHIISIFRLLDWSPTLIISENDTVLSRFRFSERDFYETFKIFDRARLLGLSLPTGTLVLSTLLSIAILRISQTGFWWFLMLAVLIGISGVGGLVAFYTVTGDDVPVLQYVEASGWLLAILGLFLDRASGGTFREPVVIRDLGLFLVAATSLYYVASLWLEHITLIVLVAAASFLYLSHFVVLCRTIGERRSFQVSPESGKNIAKQLASNTIPVISICTSGVAVFYAWQANQFNKTSGYPHIEIVDSQTTRVSSITTKDSLLFCRREIVINNVGGSGTSITEVDFNIYINEVGYVPNDASLRVLRRAARQPKELPTSRLAEPLFRKVAKDYYSYAGTLSGTQSNHESFPGMASFENNFQGLNMVYIWGTEAPSPAEVIDAIQKSGTASASLVFSQQNRRTNLFTKPVYEYFEGREQGTLPLFLPPNQSGSIFIDVVVLPKFIQVTKPQRKNSNLPRSGPIGLEYELYTEMKKVRSGEIDVDIESLVHFTNHAPIPNGLYTEEDRTCKFQNAVIPAP